MNREPDFEASADMRLLELQRSALGLTAPPPTRWESRYGSDATAGVTGTEEPFEGASAVLVVETTANPPGGVIPGTVVTFSLSIANEGTQRAANVRVAVPIPGNAAYRTGSLVIDGRGASEDLAQRFFGDGLEIGEIAAGNRATFVWKIGVRLGLGPLVAIPTVRATNAAVVGARSVRVTRRNQRETSFATEVTRAEAAFLEEKPLIPVEIPADDLPIYELDAEETLVYEAADAALSSAAPPHPEPEPEPEPAPEPEPEPVVEIVDAPAHVEITPVREAVVLYGRFDRTTLVFFERTFNGSKTPTLLQHCIFASALACTSDARGGEMASLKTHLDAQSQVLHRIALHEKLGKKEPIVEYKGALLAPVWDLSPAVVEPAPARTAGQALFVTELSAPALAVVRKIGEERDRWDFIKARQLTLALQAQRAIVDDQAAAAAIENALRSYAQLSMSTLQKLFVRIRIDRTTGLLFAGEPALDAAARAVLTALSSIIER